MSQISVSPELRSALEEFTPFLLSDDVDRTEGVAASESATLRRLLATIQPLFGEINQVLEAMSEKRSLSDDEQDLESDLHSLAQAALEAEAELSDREE